MISSRGLRHPAGVTKSTKCMAVTVTLTSPTGLKCAAQRATGSRTRRPQIRLQHQQTQEKKTVQPRSSNTHRVWLAWHCTMAPAGSHIAFACTHQWPRSTSPIAAVMLHAACTSVPAGQRLLQQMWLRSLLSCNAKTPKPH